MTDPSKVHERRRFLKTTLLSSLAVALPSAGRASTRFSSDHLQVWSCGGLAEAFIPANEAYEKRTGVKISYTGAFAAALGKSLLGGATTEVFGGRVLELAKKLRQADKMVYFKPLCFTSYVMVTPRGNPAGIEKIQDMARPGVRVVLAPDASHLHHRACRGGACGCGADSHADTRAGGGIRRSVREFHPARRGDLPQRHAATREDAGHH